MASKKRNIDSMTNDSYEEDYEEGQFFPQGFTIAFDPPEDNDSDYEDEVPRGGQGIQVLPVAELKNSNGFDGVPKDGLEYLYMVRREALTRPKVASVPNPYDVPSPALDSPSKSKGDNNDDGFKPPSNQLRQAYLDRFQALRSAYRVPNPPTTTSESLEPHYFPLPKPEDSSAWKVYINGKKRPKQKQHQKQKQQQEKSQSQTVQSDLLTSKTQSLTVSAQQDGEGIEEEGEITAEQLASIPFTGRGGGLLEPEEVYLPKLPTPTLLQEFDAESLISLITHLTEWTSERHQSYKSTLSRLNTPSTIFVPPKVMMRNKKNVGSGSTSTNSNVNPNTNNNKGNPPTTNKPFPKPQPKLPPSPLILTPLEAQWLFACLSSLDLLLTSDDIGQLRVLARCCVDIVRTLSSSSSTMASTSTYSTSATSSSTKETESKDSSQQEENGKEVVRDNQEEDEDSKKIKGQIETCWMIVAAIAGLWFQGDLWEV